MSGFGMVKLAAYSAETVVMPLKDLTTGDKNFKGDSNPALLIAMKSDKKILPSRSRAKESILWDLTAGNIIKILKGHGGSIKSVSFSPDGKILASGGKDNSIILWDVAEGKIIKTINGRGYTINFLYFSPDGKTLVSRGDDETTSFWNVATGRRLNFNKEHSEKVNSVAISPDGKTLASTIDGDEKTITLWNVGVGNIKKTLKGHSENVTSLCISPDGKVLASGSKDNSIILWEVASGNIITTLNGHNDDVRALSFSPDVKILASVGNDATIILWDIKYQVISSADKKVVVDKTGCELDSDDDGVSDCLDKCPDTPKRLKVDETGCPILTKEKVSIDLKVEFASDRAEIKSVYYKHLEEVATFLKTFPNTEAVINGHTDSVASEKYNLKLSQKRAEKVMRYLIDKYGIDPSRIKAKGFGESMPVADNNTKEGRQRNRRVIAVISTFVEK
jgi:WD40 repeat protein